MRIVALPFVPLLIRENTRPFLKRNPMFLSISNRLLRESLLRLNRCFLPHPYRYKNTEAVYPTYLGWRIMKTLNVSVKTLIALVRRPTSTGLWTFCFLIAYGADGQAQDQRYA